MYRVEPSVYPRLQPLLAELGPHLAVAALLAGRVPGTVWADDAEHPTIVMAQTRLHGFVAGGVEASCADALCQLLTEQVLPAAQEAGQPGMMIHASDAAWAGGLEAALRNLLPESGPRQVYERAVSAGHPPAQLPAGFTLRAVDAALLDEEHLTRLAELREELRSERPSVEAFLQESFGVCAVAGPELAGWCLSEYNLDDRCEVGIATAEPFRQRGLATALTHALLHQAAQHGVTRVGWHCWTRNVASAATARKAGFQLIAEENVRFKWWG
jgi:RimJ/RimL family protein N-acetyltransferase